MYLYDVISFHVKKKINKKGFHISIYSNEHCRYVCRYIYTFSSTKWRQLCMKASSSMYECIINERNNSYLRVNFSL